MYTLQTFVSKNPSWAAVCKTLKPVVWHQQPATFKVTWIFNLMLVFVLTTSTRLKALRWSQVIGRLAIFVNHSQSLYLLKWLVSADIQQLKLTEANHLTCKLSFHPFEGTQNEEAANQPIVQVQHFHSVHSVNPGYLISYITCNWHAENKHNLDKYQHWSAFCAS